MPGDPGYASELAAVVALRHPRGPLEGRQGARRALAVGCQAAEAAGDTDLLIAVEFRGMGEWQDISRKLGATPGWRSWTLPASRRAARGSPCAMRKAPQQLADALARQGLNLRNAGGNWVLVPAIALDGRRAGVARTRWLNALLALVLAANRASAAA